MQIWQDASLAENIMSFHEHRSRRWNSSGVTQLVKKASDRMSRLGAVIDSALNGYRSGNGPPRLMFVRLIRSRRLLAGWMAAAIYLLCVIAPPVALALGSGPAPCLAEDMLPVVMHTHAHDHGSMHAHHHLADEGAPSGHHHDGKGLPGPCCVMLCAVAIPADLPTVAAPLRPAALRLAEADQAMAGRMPPLLYRPPIA